MTHRKGAIWTERLLLGLILISLAATLNLLLAIHRQAPADRPASTPEIPTPRVAEARERSPAPPDQPAPAKSPVVAEKTEPQPPPPPAEDPTEQALQSLAAATAKEIAAANDTDRRTLALEQGYRSAVAESDRWKRREMLVRQQIVGITVQAEKLEREADALNIERDVLEQERDATKAALAKVSKQSGFAVLPYKGPNGTWRRPIVVECMSGGAKLQPRGPSFTMLELSPRIHPRVSTFVKAIARELLHIRSADTPDGATAVPYIVFLVRPDGIGPYYLARTCLEPLGIAFGYELVEQKLAVNIPDFDDLTTWDGTMPLDIPLEPAPGAGSSPARLAQAEQNGNQPVPSPSLAGSPAGDPSSMIGSPDGSRRGSRPGGQGGPGSRDSGPEDFVWPGRGRQAARAGEPSSSPFAAGAPESQVAGGGAGQDPGDPSGGSGPGAAAGTANSEDVGRGASAGPDYPPFSSGSPLTRGTDGGPRGTEASPGGTDSVFRLPNFEPAGDQAAGASSPGRVGQSPGAGSSGTRGAGVQTTPFSLGQISTGSSAPSGGDAPATAAGPLAQTGGAVPPGASGSGPFAPSSSGTQPPGARPGTGESTLEPATAANAVGTGGRGQARGFNWNQAAQDGGQADGTDALGFDPALGAQPPDGETGPRRSTSAAGTVAPSGSQVGSTPPASAQPGVQAGAYPGGPYSQDDANRARALSGLSSLVSPSLAEKLADATPAASSGSGMPSSFSSSNSGSNSQSGGMPLGDMSLPSQSSSSSSSSSFGQNSSPDSSSDKATELMMPPRPKETPPMGSIDVRFPIVVVCRKDEVVLQPGSYRLTGDVLRSGGQGSDSILAREVRAMVRNRAIVDPMIRQKPAIRFLVESQGADTFALARRQLLFSLPDWPVSLQVAGSQDTDIFSRNRW